MKQENKLPEGRFQKGAPGNAARCPTNARTRIPGELLPNLATALETRGESILGVWRQLIPASSLRPPTD